MPEPNPENWTLSADGKCLQREFKLDSYQAGVDLAVKVAGLAEEMNHHPDMELGYKRLAVRWTTHSAGGLTELDREAARRVNQMAP